MTWHQPGIDAALPVTVADVAYNDPVLTVSGAQWSLSLVCPWSGSIGSHPVDWEDDEVEDLAWELIGNDLISVTEGSPGVIDFCFTNAVLHVRPDTDLDPWVLHLPHFVAVGKLL